MAYALTKVLPPEALRALPDAPRRAAARIIDEDDDREPKVEMIVAKGNSYGAAKAGERVMVTADEAALQTRRNPLDGTRMGALETPDEAEARANAPKAEDQESPRYRSSLLKAAVDKGLELLGIEAAAKRAAARRRSRPRRSANASARRSKTSAAAAVVAAGARGRREAQLSARITEPVGE